MPGKEILVVDDDVMAQNMLTSALANAGYPVSIASNGEEGITKAKETLPRIIVLDIMMPGLDGGEVANILKGDQTAKDIPIIFLPSLVSEKEEKIGSKKDMISILSKPYSREKLLNGAGKYFY